MPELDLQELQQAKISFRSELFQFVEDRAKALRERASSGESPEKLLELAEATFSVLFLAHKFLLLTDKEEDESFEKVISSCPLSAEHFSENGFNLPFGAKY